MNRSKTYKILYKNNIYYSQRLDTDRNYRHAYWGEPLRVIIKGFPDLEGNQF